jgi:hypothetical protein
LLELVIEALVVGDMANKYKSLVDVVLVFEVQAQFAVVELPALRPDTEIEVLAIDKGVIGEVMVHLIATILHLMELL